MNDTTNPAQSVGMREALEDIWALTASYSQYTLDHFARKVRAKVDAALAAQPPADPVETLTIDDVPSCGQENDYRRAKPAAPVETAMRWSRTDLANFIRWFMCCERGEAAEPLASGGNGIADRMAHAILTGEVGNFAGGPAHSRSSAGNEPDAWQYRYRQDGPWIPFAEGKVAQHVLDYWRRPVDQGGMGCEVRPLFANEPQATPDIAAGLKKAMEIVGEMRMSEAGIFDEKHSGQRGEDRSNALYDAYVAIRSALPRPQCQPIPSGKRGS